MVRADPNFDEDRFQFLRTILLHNHILLPYTVIIVFDPDTAPGSLQIQSRQHAHQGLENVGTVCFSCSYCTAASKDHALDELKNRINDNHYFHSRLILMMLM